MKSLLKSISVGVLLLAATSASAGTLFWQVTADSNRTFDEAWLVAATDYNDSGTWAYLDNRDSDGLSPSSTPLTQTDLNGYETSAYTFFIEMVNYDSGRNEYTTVAQSRPYTYDQLVSSGYVSTGAVTAHSAMTAALEGNMGQIPEPSSGLLLLMGGAMLALRRRRQK